VRVRRRPALQLPTEPEMRHCLERSSFVFTPDRQPQL
jgi:hypothetical protein